MLGGGQVGKQYSRLRITGYLARCEQQPHRAAKAVANRVKFTIQSAFCAANTAGNAPFLAGCMRCDEP